MSFRIKICGITRPEDARAAVDAGADAIGLNFFAGSPRYVDLRQAAAIAAVVPEDVCLVGVFVNAEVAEMRATAREVPLRMFQLHGEEPARRVGSLAEFPCARAFRCRTSPTDLTEDIRQVVEYVHACQRAGTDLAAVLLDAHVAGQWGGTGATLDWRALAASRPQLGGTRLILAGGLRPENVAGAIAQVRPDGVDTASGVESSPGIKDPRRMAEFVQAAIGAFNALRTLPPSH